MLQVRHSESRGKANHGWLDSKHSFSFGHYYDPEHVGFGPLLVINEDRVQGGQGFGDVQRMSAGTGVRHSEFNHNRDELVHFLQIWIQPNQVGIPPSYEEKNFTPESKLGKLALIASPDGRNGSVLIHQNAEIYASIMNEGDSLQHALKAGRNGYVHVIRGAVTVNGVPLKAGDALKISDEAAITLEQAEAAELLVFDLPK